MRIATLNYATRDGFETETVPIGEATGLISVTTSMDDDGVITIAVDSQG